MGIEELKKKFIVDQDVLKARLEPIVAKALKYCLIDKNGQVLITQAKMPGRDQVMLVLSARAIASQLESKIAAETNVAEIAKYTGLPENQIRARGKELIEKKFAESPKPGIYCALSHKIESFLDSLASAASPKHGWEIVKRGR